MRSNSKKLPDDIVEHWPEVFADIDFGVIPVHYLDAVRVSFHDGKTWNIDIADSKMKNNPEEIERNLLKLFLEHQEAIKHIDFRLDAAQIKSDIMNKTDAFMKKPK
tara:strand:+ start:699 stop:1016 length:318 start_codon:yes stop_codon:yes gene_type:complete